MSSPTEAMPAQNAHFGTMHGRAAWLARRCDASAFLHASRAGSPRFSRLLRRRQSLSVRCALGGPHSAAGGDAHDNTRAPYGAPDDEDSACANAPVPQALCPRLAGHRGVRSVTSPSVLGLGACLPHRRLPARRRGAPLQDKNRAPRPPMAGSRPDHAQCLARRRPL